MTGVDVGVGVGETVGRTVGNADELGMGADETEDGVTLLQTRSDVAVGSCVSYCVGGHSLQARHPREPLAPQSCAPNSPAAHGGHEEEEEEESEEEEDAAAADVVDSGIVVVPLKTRKKNEARKKRKE